jgi:hypothetical protein
MLTPRLEIWQSGTELREALNLWLESLEARGIAPRTLESYRESVGKFVAFLALTPCNLTISASG